METSSHAIPKSRIFLATQSAIGRQLADFKADEAVFFPGCAVCPRVYSRVLSEDRHLENVVLATASFRFDRNSGAIWNYFYLAGNVALLGAARQFRPMA